MGLHYEIKDGRLQFRCPTHRVSLQNLRPSVRYTVDGSVHSYRPILTRDGTVLRSEPNKEGIEICFAVREVGTFLVLEGKLRNTGHMAVRVDAVATLWLSDSGRIAIGGSANEWMIYRNGYQSWTGTRSFSPVEFDPVPYCSFVQASLLDPRHLPRQRRGEFRSEIVTAIEHRPTANTLVVGFLDARSVFCAIELAVNGDHCERWQAVLDYEGTLLLPGREVPLPPLALACGNNAYRLLCDYAELSGRTMEARVPPAKPNGWCSWYYYFTGVDEGAVLENLESAQQMRSIFPIDYIQVDDGYQADIGDWLDANTKFPNGMPHIAERIRQAGFRPGIWLAPFLALSRSQLYRQHPDWFVRDEEGNPVVALRNPLWGWRACHALDTTHPEAILWLRKVIDTIVHRWGFDVVKLDFLYAAALPGRRHDREVNRAAALRKGLEAIREVAPNAFLIGCGCPLGPAVGIVDSMRIGPDVAPFWSNTISRIVLRDLHGVATKHAVRNILARSFLHKRWWLNDPDCLMVRATSTQLDEEEFRSLATAIVLTDGLVVLSDRLAMLGAKELERLRQTIELAPGDPPAFVDVMAGDFPDTLVHISSEQCIVAIWNPLDTPRAKHVELTRLLPHAAKLTHVPEYWTGAILPVREGVVDLGTLPPRSTRVLTVPPP